MLDEFKVYLQTQGKSANTIKTYLRDVELFLRWCTQSFDKEPDRLYRANVQDYISYMRNIRRYSAGSVNNHLSSLRCYNKFLIETAHQTDTVVLQKDFMKIQRAYAKPPARWNKRTSKRFGSGFSKAAINGTMLS